MADAVACMETSLSNVLSGFPLHKDFFFKIAFRIIAEYEIVSSCDLIKKKKKKLPKYKFQLLFKKWLSQRGNLWK